MTEYVNISSSTSKPSNGIAIGVSSSVLISKGSTNGASLIGFTVNENDVVSDKKSSLTTAKISACPVWI